MRIAIRVIILSVVLFFVISLLVGVFLAKWHPKNNNTPTQQEEALDRPHYQMKYYSDWTIDSTDKDFDLDSYFTLNTASGSGFISFFIFNRIIDEKEHLDAQIKTHNKLMKDGNVSLFETWGKYKGHGATIDGKFSGAFKGEVKIFVHSCDSCSFLVAYQFFNRDKERDLPGFNLIETTFKIN
jgi:hypothetical protein